MEFMFYVLFLVKKLHYINILEEDSTTFDS
jgi:hypothetical protein